MSSRRGLLAAVVPIVVSHTLCAISITLWTAHTCISVNYKFVPNHLFNFSLHLQQ